MKKYFYNTNTYNFIDEVTQLFNVSSLDQIHTILEQNLEIPTDPNQDQKTIFHKIFYKLYEDNNSNFLNTYRNFVKNLAEIHFPNEEIIFQTKPTFRVQIPNNIAVAQWHKDKAYNHSSKETNIFLPLTKAFDTNTVWVESEEDKGDYAPMNAQVGEYYVWNGANLCHGNKKNNTGVSRVSLDFRIILANNFLYDGTSVTTKVPMKLGYYWSELN